MNLGVRIYPGRYHVDSLFHDYKVLINPSTTAVVCMTTAEALAMGKIVICANHPSNEFFKQFPNCHTYNTNNEFMKLTLAALAEDPVPLTDEHRHALSWEAATERFVEAADLNEATQEKALAAPKPFMLISSDDWSRSVEEASAYLHNTVSGIEAAHCVFGAIPETLQPDEQLRKELGLVSSERKLFLGHQICCSPCTSAYITINQLEHGLACSRTIVSLFKSLQGNAIANRQYIVVTIRHISVVHVDCHASSPSEFFSLLNWTFPRCIH
ncbi:unnamed protein product [Musa acuminata var. zebrina]